MLTEAGITPQQRMLIGAYEGLPVLEPTPYLDLFTKGTPWVSETTQLEFDYKINKNVGADLVTKGSTGKGIITPNEFKRVKITPGDIVATDVLTARELELMQAGNTQIFRVGGQNIQTGTQLAARKSQYMKNAIAKRKNIMAAQAINGGIVYNTDSSDYIDYGIPTAKTMTYNTSTIFLAELADKFAEYRKITGMNQDKTLIGIDIVKKILGDTKFQDTMYKLGYTNITKDMSVKEAGLVVGVFLGKMLEQADVAFDDKGVDIVNGNVIKMLSTSQLNQGFAAIEVKKTMESAPELWAGDIWIDIDGGSKMVPVSTIFARCGWFPIIIDPNSIYTVNVTIA